MNERELTRMAQGLGRAAADGLDVERTAAAVTARLRAERVRHRPRPVARWLALAAGFAVLLAGTAVTLGDHGAVPRVQPVALAPGLDDLSPAELGELLDSLQWQAPVSLDVGTTLGELDGTQLEELLALMEG